MVKVWLNLGKFKMRLVVPDYVRLGRSSPILDFMVYSTDFKFRDENLNVTEEENQKSTELQIRYCFHKPPIFRLEFSPREIFRKFYKRFLM